MNQLSEFLVRQDNLQLLYLTLAFGAGMLALMASMMVYLQSRQLSRYSERLHKAVLSEVRESYERQISQLNIQLTATDNRWREVNHLIVSGQNAQSSMRKSGGRTEYVSFLSRFGVDRKNLNVDTKLVFVLTPFSNEERRTFESIQKACAEVGFITARGDETNAQGDILGQIIGMIVRARIIVANITSRNPNVFYELGIAHALGKPTLLVSKIGTSNPFDVQGTRIIMYESEEKLPDLLKSAILKLVLETEEDES